MTGLSLLMLLALGSAGDIFHCKGRDGAMTFQDKPCANNAGTLLSSKSDSDRADLMRLRQALKKIERSAATTPEFRARTRPSSQTFPRWANRGPADANLLAACSSQFFACASGDTPRMDRCVAGIARCGAGRGSGCCPAECLSRYQDLRRAQFSAAQSVRDALLDDSVGSCAAR